MWRENTVLFSFKHPADRPLPRLFTPAQPRSRLTLLLVISNAVPLVFERLQPLVLLFGRLSEEQVPLLPGRAVHLPGILHAHPKLGICKQQGVRF